MILVTNFSKYYFILIFTYSLIDVSKLIIQRKRDNEAENMMSIKFKDDEEKRLHKKN